MRAGDARTRAHIAYSASNMKHAGGWDYRTKDERKSYDHERYMRQREQRLRRMAAYREEHREELNAKKRKRYRETIWAKYHKT